MSGGDESLMIEKKKKTGILIQVAILFVISILASGFLTLYSQHVVSDALVKRQMESLADQVGDETRLAVMEYPAHDWLLRYWYEHSDEMEIEYDTVYYGGSETEEKYALLTRLHPEFWPDYASVEDVEALQPEEQKLYAEIIYSWLIDRINYVQSAYDLDYLFCVVTEDPYDQQSVLFIAAEDGEIRGSEPGQVYPIGKSIKVSGEKQKAMREAVSGKPQTSLSKEQKYYDYFYYLTSIDEHKVLFVQTIDVMRVRKAVSKYLFDFGFLFAFLIIVLAFSCLLMINYLVLMPLKKVQKNIDLYKETKDSRMVANNLLKIKSHNEIAELSGDVAGMAEELTAYMVRNEQIAVKEERDKTELALAGRIQASMLPNVFPPYPDRKDFEIYASMTPAREVGGDFYEFFLIDDRHLCMMIADVSGKGIPAALFMMATKILLENNVKMGKSPAQTLSDINTAICNKNIEDMFVTVWLGIIDLSTGKMTCANAGHEYPMLKKPGELYEIVKDKHDLVLGAMNGQEYKEYELLMEPGASMFLYTDGLSETNDPEEQMFGTERILEQLNTEPDCSPEETLHGMKEAVDKFIKGKEPFDDMTMMSFAYHGPTE